MSNSDGARERPQSVSDEQMVVEEDGSREIQKDEEPKPLEDKLEIETSTQTDEAESNFEIEDDRGNSLNLFCADTQSLKLLSAK